MSFSYWLESIHCILDDLGVDLPDETVKEIAYGIEGCADNQSTYMGYDCIPDPRITEIQNLKTEHTRTINRTEEYYNKRIKDLEDEIYRLNRTVSDLSYKLQDARRN